MNNQNDFSKSCLELLNSQVDDLSTQQRWEALVEIISTATKRALKRKEDHESESEKEN